MEHFSAGQVLGRSFAIWFKNFIPFVFLSAIIYAPIIAYTVIAIGGLKSADDPVKVIQTWSYVMIAAGVFLDFIVTGSIVYGVVQEMLGSHASVGACIAVGFQRLLPVLGAAILVGLVVILGLVALIIPGIILMCRYYVTVPVSVIESPGIMASLSRSKELTEGYKASIFGIVFVLGLIEKGISFILEKVLITSLEGAQIYIFVNLGVSIALGALGATASAVAYVTLRQEKDGASVNDLARVFS